jgi:hypothetical protein
MKYWGAVMEKSSIIVHIIALILFVLSVISMKLKWNENYRFSNPKPLSVILQFLLYLLMIIFGLIASIWDIIDLF